LVNLIRLKSMKMCILQFILKQSHDSFPHWLENQDHYREYWHCFNTHTEIHTYVIEQKDSLYIYRTVWEIIPVPIENSQHRKHWYLYTLVNMTYNTEIKLVYTNSSENPETSLN
jgi:hypothetical protein